MTDRDRSTRTLGRDDRGQTVQDFAIGASVFLLTVAFTFAFVPSIFTPFQSEVQPGAAPQADRVATSTVQDLSVANRSNWLSQSRTFEFFRDSTRPTNTTDLKNRYRLPLGSSVNISIVPVDGGPPVVFPPANVRFAVGQEFGTRPGATASRIVVVKGLPECDPTIDADTSVDGVQGKACRMIVRVW